MRDRIVQRDEESAVQRSVSSLYGDAEPTYELNRCEFYVIFTTEPTVRLVLASLEADLCGIKRLSGESGRQNEPKRKRGHGKCHLKAEAHHRVALGLG